MALERVSVTPGADGRIGARFFSSNCGGALGDNESGGDFTFVDHLQPDGPAAQAGLQVGDHVTSIHGRAIGTTKDLQSALRGAAPVVVEVRRSMVAPSEEAFENYCGMYPLSRSDVVFQAKHRHIGGWCVQGTEALDESVLPCDGCPECLFGVAPAELSAEQASEPKVLRWRTRPQWLRRCATRPSQSEPRFRVGDRVRMHSAHDDSWRPATIVSIRYSDPGWPEGFFVPYGVEDEDGVRSYVALDTDEYVRKA